MNNPSLRFTSLSQADWYETCLSDVVDVVGGGTPSTSQDDYWNGDVQWFTPSEITQKYVTESSRTITEEGVSNSSARYLPQGTILFTSRASLGLSSINVSPKKVTTNQGFQSLIPKEGWLSEFVYYLVNNRKFIQEVENRASGSTFKEISSKNLKSITLLVPSDKTEQQKIAAFFTALDEKISIATKKLIQFKNLKKEIARSLFEDCAAEDFKKIGDFARTFAGATPSTSHKEYWENGTIPWMSSGEINNRYIHSVEKRITALGFDKTSTKWVKKGSTLVALAGQGKTRGKVAFTEMELCTNQSLAAIECDREEVNDKYLFFFLETQYENLRAQSTGDGGRGGLNLFIINNFEVPILPLHEQVRIVSILELIDKKIELAENKLLVLEQVKRAFMQQMFV